VSAGALPHTSLGEVTAPPRPMLDLRGPTSKGRGGKGIWQDGKVQEGEEVG